MMNLVSSFTDPNAMVILVKNKLSTIEQMHAATHGIARFVHSTPAMTSWGRSWATGENDLAIFATTKKGLAAFKTLPGAIFLIGVEWDDHAVVFRGTPEAAPLVEKFKFIDL